MVPSKTGAAIPVVQRILKWTIHVASPNVAFTYKEFEIYTDTFKVLG